MQTIEFGAKGFQLFWPKAQQQVSLIEGEVDAVLLGAKFCQHPVFSPLEGRIGVFEKVFF